MTGYLSIRQSTFDGLSPLRTALLRRIFKDVTLLPTTASVWNDGTVDRYVWGDTRFDDVSFALIGALAGNIQAFEEGGVEADVRDDAEGSTGHGRLVRQYVFGWLMGRAVLALPSDVPDGGTGNRGQELLDANGAPAILRFDVQAPADLGWTTTSAGGE